jgi:hypothetical protein
MSPLTTQQILEELEREIPAPKTEGLTALAALQATKDALADRAAYEKQLLSEVVPQALELVREIRASGEEVAASESDIPGLTWSRVTDQIESRIKYLAQGPVKRITRLIAPTPNAQPHMAPIPQQTAAPLRPISAKEVWENHTPGSFTLYLPNGNGKDKKIHLECQPTANNGPVLVLAEDAMGFMAGENISLSAIQDEKGKVRYSVKVSFVSFGSDMQAKEKRMRDLAETLKRAFVYTLDTESPAEISPRDFLTGKPGKCLLNFSGFKWKQDNPEDDLHFDSLSLYFVRDKSGQIALTEVVSGGAKAKELFASNLGIFQEPGEKFSGITPTSCAVFLKACFATEVLRRTPAPAHAD